MNEHLKLSPAGANLIKHFEGCLKPHGKIFKAYRCPANVWTIGWGSTHHGGWDINAATEWTLEKCSAAFLTDMEAFERDVRKLVRVPLEQFQFDAITSFHYNTGALGKSTLLKKLNARDYDGAAQEFKKWNKANGKILAGLTRRRNSESLLFQGFRDDNYDGVKDPAPPPHPMPQAVDEPPTG
jgi:lysozyme